MIEALSVTLLREISHSGHNKCGDRPTAKNIGHSN